ncbi:hypothetical protein THAOC_33124, partial [Thalassiosira oceanica]
MKGRSPDETTATGRVTSVRQQERGSADQPDQPDQPSPPARPPEDTEDSGDGTSLVAQESPPARPSDSGDDTPSFVAVEGGFTPTASEGREKDLRDDDTGKSTTSSTSVGLICLEDDDEVPMDIAQISVTLEQRDRAEKAEAQRINEQTSNEEPSAVQGAVYDDGGPSASSTSAELITQVDDGPMDAAEIAAFFGRQERDKTANDRINSESSTPDQTGDEHVMTQSGSSLGREDRLTNPSGAPDEDGENESHGSGSVGNFEEPVIVVPNDADLEGGEYLAGEYLAEAYIVPVETVYEATTALPWFKQRRTVLMMAVILALLAVLAVSVSVAFTREPVQPTNEPTFSPAPSASSTSVPSITSAPSNNPTTSNIPTKYPTLRPTLRPSGSPTLRPTNYPITSNYRAKLLAPDGAAGDQFGHSVGMYGDAIVVGVPYEENNGPDSGSAHVFLRSREGWTHQAKLLAPGGAARDQFGWSSAIYGDTIVVGAHLDDDNGDNSGSAHVFVRSGEVWTHQAKLLAPDGAPRDYFGWSVAIYGDTIVVGAHWDDDYASDSELAHVFVRSGEEWTHQAKLLAPDGAAGD